MALTLHFPAAPEPSGSDRAILDPKALLRFEELRANVARISRIMIGPTATAPDLAKAERALAEIADQAHAARLALRRGRA